VTIVIPGRRGAALAGLLILLAGASVACGAASAARQEQPTRTVQITIHFSRFDQSSIAVQPGETVRFIVENTDPIDHEFIVGDDAVQLVHELGTEAHHPPRPGEMSVPADTTRETTYTFPAEPGTLTFACHLPGHFKFGMYGTLVIG
jgi:uncharacterized cupredoxin-like copper-binding protein